MYVIDFNSDGCILQTRSGSGLSVIDGMNHLWLDAYPGSIADMYIVDGAITPLPERPSRFHRFDYVSKQWIDPRTPDTEWPLVRTTRDRLLQASDWTQLPDVPLATKQAWATYRQALRDVTEQPDPFNISWPVAP